MLNYSTYKHKTSKSWVTFIHGAGGSSSIWFKQIRDFKLDHNLLLIDLRGHGGSDVKKLKPINKYSFKSVGDDVMEVLDFLKIEKTHTIGVSLGTIIIRDLSERYPSRISSMILTGAILKFNLRGQFLMKLGWTFQSLVPYMMLYKFFAFIILPKKNNKESRVLFINEAKKMCQKEFKKWYKLTSEINPLLKWFRTKPSSIPSLYVMGANDYMFLPAIEKNISSNPKDKLIVVPDCGHVVNVEKATEFNRISLNFLSYPNENNLEIPL